MRRRQRETPDAFGTSLLDLMTCSLGAVILVFLLRQAYQAGATTAAEERLAYQNTVSDLLLLQQQKAEERLEAAHDTIRRAATGWIFGLPPLRGHVMVVVDRSGSMEGNKIKCAEAIVELILRNNPLVTSLSVATFSTEYELLFPATQVDQPHTRDATIEKLLATFRDRVSTVGAWTNLIAGIRDSVSRIERESPAGGTIVLISDGLHALAGETDLSIEEVLSRSLGTRKQRGTDSPITIHCIGLFSDLDQGQSADELGRLLRAVAGETRGVFLGLHAGAPR